MTVKEAIGAIRAPKGITSIISGVMSGDYSVLPHEKGKDANDLEKAREMVAQYKKSLDECQSDWAYWSILGDKVYWEAICDILEAGALVGNDNLPDIPAPNLDGLVVMDCIGKVGDYGRAILNKAKTLSPLH